MALIPTSSPLAFTNAPPLLPWLMAASVWMKDWMFAACPLEAEEPMARAFALTIPAVTVEFRLNGLPTANTHSPTFNWSESPTGIVGKSSPSILINAKSVLGSVPMMRPFSSRSSFSFTVISSAPSTTWLFVTIYPSLEMMTPEPKPTRGWVCIWRWRPRPSPKKKSKISGCSCTVWVLLNWVARICTTAWSELSAACVKSTGWASVEWKAAGSRLLGFCWNNSLNAAGFSLFSIL